MLLKHAGWMLAALLLLQGCDAFELGEESKPVIQVVRAPARVQHDPPFIPQRLDLATTGSVFPSHVERAYERWRHLKGRNGVPATLFEKMVAAADYVAQFAKHPHRHKMGLSHSDPRALAFFREPEILVEIAEENQMWTGQAWEPASGKTLADVPPLECSYQHLILGGIANVIGVQWRLIEMEAHTAFAYYDFEYGKWVYIESTFNEHYRRKDDHPSDYVPLSPGELYQLSREGRTGEIVAVRHPYQPQRPLHELRPYVEEHPAGWAFMAPWMLGTSVPDFPALGWHTQVLPGAESYFAQQIQDHNWGTGADPATIWSPQGETFLDSLYVSPGQDSVEVWLSTNLAVPDAQFEVNLEGGSGWEQIGSHAVLRVQPGANVLFRAVGQGHVSGEVVLRSCVGAKCKQPARSH